MVEFLPLAYIDAPRVRVHALADYSIANEYPMPQLGAGSIRSGSLALQSNRVALATTDGALCITSLGSSECDHFETGRAVAAAWSNDGTRLAVLEAPVDRSIPQDFTAPPADFTLRIRDSATLASLAEYSMSLPAAVTLQFSMSWDPNDPQILVSTDLRGAGFEAAPEVGTILALDSGQTSTLCYSNAYFVSEDTIVGSTYNEDCVGVVTVGQPGPVYQIRLVDGTVAERARIDGATICVASNPRLGLFLTEEKAGFNLGTTNFAPLRLRSVDGSVSPILGPVGSGARGQFEWQSGFAIVP